MVDRLEGKVPIVTVAGPGQPWDRSATRYARPLAVWGVFPAVALVLTGALACTRSSPVVDVEETVETRVKRTATPELTVKFEDAPSPAVVPTETFTPAATPTAALATTPTEIPLEFHTPEPDPAKPPVVIEELQQIEDYVVAYTAIDVNKLDGGDANLLVGPTGKVALIDAGLPTMGDVVIIPYLLERGITRIDYLIMTHPDPDHLGGMTELMNSALIEIIGLYMPKLPPWDEIEKESKAVASPSYYKVISTHFETVMEATENAGVQIHHLITGDRLDMGSGTYLETLLGWDSTFRTENGLILKMVAGDFSILLAGDAGPESLRMLHMSGVNYSADVLKLPHHMSGDSGIKRFLGVINPRVAVGPTPDRLLLTRETQREIQEVVSHGILLLTNATHGHISIIWTGQDVLWRSEPVNYRWLTGTNYRGNITGLKNLEEFDLDWVQDNDGRFSPIPDDRPN